MCSEMACTIDLQPTLAARIGAKLPEHKIDGLNIWPLDIDPDPLNHGWRDYGARVGPAPRPNLSLSLVQ